MKQRTLLQKVLIALVVLFFLNSWWNHLKEARLRHRGSLAIVHIMGPIQSSLATPSWSASDADDVAKSLHALSEDDDVKAIVLRINSPGGTVGAIQEIDKEIA